MLKRIFSIFLVFPAALCMAQLKPVEKVERKNDGIIIPYEKYVLPNGLTVIIHEDHSDPIVHVDVTYHVGSAREEIGKSGFAHFFEHMLFQGSDNVGDDQHFKIVTESGGTLNGSTNRDRTNYYETVPSNQLERMLWLEADRMGFFLDAVTQKKFEIQRSTVKNERGQNYDNRPYGLVGEVTARNLYPYGHPYSWLTIGYVEDLNRVTLDDLKNFFLRWYGPNNATLTIGGDVVPAKVMGMVQKYFGSIPSGPEVKKMSLPVPSLKANRFVTLEDNYARLPQLVITYPTVPNFHKDMAALSCLSQVIGQGKNSALYQHLVKPRTAVSAIAYSNLSELSGEFTFQMTPVTGVSTRDLFARVQAALDSFEVRGVTEDDIKKYKEGYESSLLNGLQSVNGKVVQLAAFETFAGNPNMIGKLLEMTRSVTREDVMRVYNTYIKGKGAVVVSVVPKGQAENIAAVPNYKIDSTLTFKPEYGYEGLKYVKGKDNFDRTRLPAPGNDPVLKVPDFWQKKLKNGVSVIGSESKELPLVNISISLPGGHITQDGDSSKAGLSQFFANMMNEDTKVRTAEQMQVELQKLGASLSVSSSFDEINVTLQVPKKNLKPALVLVEERIYQPKFTVDAFNRIQQQTLETFKIRKAQPTYIADDVFSKLNYSTGHISALDPAGTTYSVKNMKIEDIETFYTRILSNDRSKVVVVGDLNEKEALASLKFLEKLPNKPLPLKPWKEAPAIAKSKIYVVDIPGAAQTEFRIGKVTGVKYDATGEFFKAGIMNYVLGGSFSSRFNLNLREDKGWTYGARSVVTGDKYTGLFTFSAGIKSSATDSALVEVLKEAKRYATDPMSSEELAFTRSSINQREALRYETLGQKAGFIGRILEYNLPADFATQQTNILKNISAQEIQSLASRWLTFDQVNILLVGDKATMVPGLKRLGYEIIELDKNGKVKGLVP